MSEIVMYLTISEKRVLSILYPTEVMCARELSGKTWSGAGNFYETARLLLATGLVERSRAKCKDNNRVVYVYSLTMKGRWLVKEKGWNLLMR